MTEVQSLPTLSLSITAAINPSLSTSTELMVASLVADWDCWPNSDFSCSFTVKEVEATNGLAEHWVNQNSGSSSAIQWQKHGKTDENLLAVV